LYHIDRLGVLQAELDAIKKSKPEGELLTLEDLKKMTLTTWVSVPLSSKINTARLN
jgi:hypothetical protein